LKCKTSIPPVQCLHIRLSRAILRPACDRGRRGTGALLHSVRARPLHHGGGGRLHGDEVRGPGEPAAGHEV